MRSLFEHWLNKQWYQNGKLCHGLAPLSFIYKKKTNAGELPSTQTLGTPVWVVGNLTVGGSGKTPMIIMLAKKALAKHLKVLVVTKPYRTETPLLKSIFLNENADPNLFGDEPCLIKNETHADVLCIAKNRSDYEDYIGSYDLILCDDGLQDHRLKRSLNLAIINNKRGFGNGHLLPRGPMRTALKWSCRIDHVIENGALTNNVAAFNLSIKGFYHLQTNKMVNVEFFKQKRILVACGLGHPERFWDSVKACGIQGESIAYSDHHIYTQKDLNFLKSYDAVIVSEKDAVKLKPHGLDQIYVTCTSMQANDHLTKLTTDLLNTITESDTIVS